jgi:hypothetical protein
MERQRAERFLEFLLVGVVMGGIEDLIAVKLATGAKLQPETILVVIAVAVPFAAFSELIVDSNKNNVLRHLSARIKQTSGKES